MTTSSSARRSLKRLWSSVKVMSCADGTLKIVPSWRGVRKYTPVEGGGPGLLSRLRAAELLGVLIKGAK